MSELKAYKGDIYIPVYGSIADAKVYLKSDADKVIAEKDKEIAELQKQVHDYAQGLYVIQARSEKEARHHKYKRCLAMATFCHVSSVLCEGPDSLFYRRWFHKWHELAEKFKEGK